MKKESGFTLLELVVVIFIISLFFLMIVPKISDTFQSYDDKVKSTFIDIINYAYSESQKLGRTIFIKGVKGSNHLYVGTRVYNLPSDLTILSAFINGKAAEGLEFNINVYPQGISDYFLIYLSNGKKVEALPLLLSVRVNDE